MHLLVLNQLDCAFSSLKINEDVLIVQLVNSRLITAQTMMLTVD